jgi:hypothetical protein
MPPSIAGLDFTFGRAPRMWAGLLVYTSRQGFWAISPNEARDLSPMNVQSLLGDQVFMPSALGVYGSDLLCGLRSGSDLNSRLWTLRQYQDGLRFNELHDFGPLTGSKDTCYALELQGTDVGVEDRLYYLGGFPTSASRLRTVDLPRAFGGGPATVSGGEIRTSYVHIPSTGRAIVLQVRGWLANALTSRSIGINASVDNGALQAMGTAAAEGPFVMAGAKPIGRTVSLQFQSNISGGSGWPVVLFPVHIDYMEEPAAGRRYVLEIDPQGVRTRAGIVATAKHADFMTLKAFEGTSQTLEFEEPSASYTVIVESVEVPHRETDRPATPIVVTVRVV